jgi:phytoene/squalene synthetase
MKSQDQLLELLDQIDFEKIVGHPNILIAARFWDDERYLAAKTCYKFMRDIDDLIDNHKSEYKEFTDEERLQFSRKINTWIDEINHPDGNNPLNTELIEILYKFQIPSWPLRNFAKSMIYDIFNNGFPTLNAFLEYAEGASIAPASIFVHLCGINKQNGKYTKPSFDVKKASTPCAIFSYLVHIIRDFQKDQNNNLTYFADNLIAKYDLTREILKDIASGDKISDSFRALINEYYMLADHYREKTCEIIEEVKPRVEERYQLSLEIIFNLYLMVFERINIKNGNFSTEELNPLSCEIRDRVQKVITDFKAI